jgi:phenylpropionate dioxygenase-like ring-hydroxylating dioxygenase large terminal subunit
VVAVAGNLDPALAHFWYPVATLEQLADQRLIHAEVIGRHYVVAALDPPGGGDPEVVAFVDACPHRGWPLSQGALVGSELRCPYHGYRFDGTGRCVAIPAQRGDLPIPSRADLQPASVTAHRGLVWLAPEEPWAPLPDLPAFDDPRFSKIVLGPYTWHAGAAQINENFLDVSHFPFVHAGTFGLESDAVFPPLRVERKGWEFSYAYDHFEDQVILEGYREPAMVLDIDAQFHTAADRMTVEFRRVLADILTRDTGGD